MLRYPEYHARVQLRRKFEREELPKILMEIALRESDANWRMGLGMNGDPSLFWLNQEAKARKVA